MAYDALQNEHHSHTLQEKYSLRDSTHTREARQYEARAVQRTGATSPRRWLIAIGVLVFIFLTLVIRKHFRWRKLPGFLFPRKPG
ncbi:hypothetical protein [Sinomicrobium pectinilyticum]|uniref:hypothetical protein n=1 Tax=Sinomicrobium pectinilyticum TaxID=1084421 RepID=UPI0011CDE527|nr:hypothetical protein [Sinomicrobium pectinilyticum]